MTIAQQLVAEFDQEAATTRRVLERLPDDKLSWRPHPTSMSLGQLGLHVATTPGGVATMAQLDTLEAPRFEQAEGKGRAEILTAHDQSVATFRQTLLTMDDAQLAATWTLTRDGRPVLQIPRAGFIRMIGMNHVYHHRGQIVMCLRMLGVAVPAVYGASRDENPFA